MRGQYDFVTDTLRVCPGAPLTTVLHEGAHAEHHARIGTVGTPPITLAQGVGLCLGSEVYVGQRLAGIAACRQAEEERLSKNEKIPERTFPALARRFRTKALFTNGRTSFLGIPGFRSLMIASTLVGMERKTGREYFERHRSGTGPYDGLLLEIVDSLFELDTNDLKALDQLGSDLLQSANALGIIVASYD